MVLIGKRSRRSLYVRDRLLVLLWLVMLLGRVWGLSCAISLLLQLEQGTGRDVVEAIVGEEIIVVIFHALNWTIAMNGESGDYLKKESTSWLSFGGGRMNG